MTTHDVTDDVRTERVALTPLYKDMALAETASWLAKGLLGAR